MKEDKIQNLRKWMVEKGCIIHPHVRIPTDFDGVLGIGTTGPLPHKTLVIAVPSSLILTTTKCYNDPKLKKMFLHNDDLFDYEASEDAEFNVLCVFMMYHRLHPEESPWREYFEAISEPETAVDWSNFELKGLNRSVIEEVVHIRRECDKLEEDLIAYLTSRKEFKDVPVTVLKEHFHFCYRAVMNRSFGYYFDQTCLIPVADLVNHSCQSVDHQLINVHLQKGSQFQEGYFPRRQRIDCSLLGLQPSSKQVLPFRHRFLIQNKIIQNDQLLSTLDRNSIDDKLCTWNKSLLKEGQPLSNLNFCSQDQEQDNDTDEDFQYSKERQLQYCKKNEEEQMGQFINHYVKVEKYQDVQKQLKKLDNKNAGNTTTKDEEKEEKGAEGERISRNDRIVDEKEKEERESAIRGEEVKGQLKGEIKAKENIQSEATTEKNKQIKHQTNRIEQPEINPFSGSTNKGVPIQIIDSSSEQEDQDVMEWGMKEGAYFTMSTSGPVRANSQIFNSYGSRTNRFLLIWYGFTYPDNLYDSVSLRLHVQFGPLRPAREVVLDTYVGGQGLSFRKNQQQMVKDTEVSRQFRLKRTQISQKLVIFLRLFLMNYYHGQDLYKLFVTFPASVDFELFVFNYYRDIVLALYERYPTSVIEQLKKEEQDEQYSKIQHKIRYKIIYLTEQRKLLDINLKASEHILGILAKCKQNEGMLARDMYEEVPMEELRVIRKYLVQYEKQTSYILYKQKQTVHGQPGSVQEKAKEAVQEKAKEAVVEKGEETMIEKGRQTSKGADEPLKSQQKVEKEEEQWQDIEEEEEIKEE